MEVDMRHLTSPAAILVVPILLASCGEASPPTAALAGRIQARADVVLSDISVNILDACDAASFDAAVGPGTCSRPGGMTFSQFIAELEKHQMVQAWDFAPPAFQAQVGQTIVATNRGGEEHTFTHVTAFGGGIIPLLNTLSGNPVVAPECNALEADDFVAPGNTYREPLDQSGTQKFQCCVHPWMRAVVQVQ
jgi:plastocyanin